MESQLELAEFVKNIKDNRPHFSGVTYSDEKLNKALLKLNKNFHTKDQIKILLGRKFHKSIKNLYKISQILKYEFITPTTIMPIATTGALTNTFKTSYRSISRLLNKAKEIGLIEPIDNKYTFISQTTTSSAFEAQAKSYVCSQEEISEIEKLSKDIGDIELEVEKVDININKDVNKVDQDKHRYVDIPVVDTFAATDKEYKFISKTLINDSDENILRGLNKHYPQLKEAYDIVEELNKKIDIPEEKILFRPNIHRGASGKVTKIGIRAASSIASYKVHEDKKNENYKGTWLKDYLNKIYGEWEEYDVHSSVPNVAYLIKTGNWLGTDLYLPISGQKEWTDKFTRDDMKSIFMKFYFNKSEKAIKKSLFDNKEYKNSGNCNFVVQQIKASMENTIGKSINSEIFLHESCIYLNVRKQLAKRGIQCSQVYDGFFFKKGEMPSDMASLVKIESQKYYQKYVNKADKVDKVNKVDIKINKVNKVDIEINKVDQDKHRYVDIPVVDTFAATKQKWTKMELNKQFGLKLWDIYDNEFDNYIEYAHYEQEWLRKNKLICRNNFYYKEEL